MGIQGYYLARPIRRICSLIIILSITLFLYNPILNADNTAPKRLATAQPGDCAACHAGGKPVLPDNHAKTKEMKLEQCLVCHPKDKDPITLKLPSSHAHTLAGVTCQKCHGQKPPFSKVDMKTCTACHGIDKLASAPAQAVDKPNPHNSHYGTDVDCALCHHQHAKSEFMCAQCHPFKNITPSPLNPLGFASKPAKEKESPPTAPNASEKGGVAP